MKVLSYEDYMNPSIQEAITKEIDNAMFNWGKMPEHNYLVCYNRMVSNEAGELVLLPPVENSMHRPYACHVGGDFIAAYISVDSNTPIENRIGVFQITAFKTYQFSPLDKLGLTELHVYLLEKVNMHEALTKDECQAVYDLYKRTYETEEK